MSGESDPDTPNPPLEEPVLEALIAQLAVGGDDVVNDNALVRFEIRKRDDLWEVVRDGRLRGGYVSRSGALSAVHGEMRELRDSGGFGELLPDVPHGEEAQ